MALLLGVTRDTYTKYEGRGASLMPHNLIVPFCLKPATSLLSLRTSSPTHRRVSKVPETARSTLHSTLPSRFKKVAIPGFRKALKEDDRIAIATTILEHLKLCGWEFSKPPEPVQ
jgi:hypothetical protein